MTITHVPLLEAIQGDGYGRSAPPTANITLKTLPQSGNAYLSSKFPDAITSVEGVPVTATVRVIYRSPNGDLADGSVVAEVQSKADGTWRVDNLNPNLLYDVVGRIANTNDIIVSQVRPIVE